MIPKQEIIDKVNGTNQELYSNGRNSMGVSENFYDPYFMLRMFAKNKELDLTIYTQQELNLMLNVAEYAGDVFY